MLNDTNCNKRYLVKNNNLNNNNKKLKQINTDIYELKINKIQKLKRISEIY